MLGAVFGALLLFQPKIIFAEEEPVEENIPSNISWLENNCGGEFIIGNQFTKIGGFESSQWNPALRTGDVPPVACDETEKETYWIVGFKD